MLPAAERPTRFSVALQRSVGPYHLAGSQSGGGLDVRHRSTVLLLAQGALAAPSFVLVLLADGA